MIVKVTKGNSKAILYEKQMISIDISLFTRIENQLKVLLVKRTEEPFKSCWSLLGGKVYNNESCETAVLRELDEKLALKNIESFLTGVFSNPVRDPRFRNISVSYYGICASIPKLTINERKLSEIEFFGLDALPLLAFDHEEILKHSLKILREQIYDPRLIKQFVPDIFTLKELQEFFESIFLAKLDKRNFRRKISSLDCLVKTGEKNEKDTRKKSDYYKLK